MANKLTIIGLALDIFGVWGLAYEILWGFPKRNRRFVLETRLSNEKWFLGEHEKNIEKLPEPPYKTEEKDNFRKELRERHDPTIAKLENEIKMFHEGHTERSFIIASVGIVLVTIGFVLQIMGALD